LLHLDSYGYKINWMIAGCESGTSARDAKKEWFTILQEQCDAFKIPYFLKQMVVDGKLVHLPELDGKVWAEFPEDK
jgi:protein gp37